VLVMVPLLPGCSIGGMGAGVGVAVDSGADTTGATPASAAPTVAITRGKPLDAYVAMGGVIKRCWFNPVDPLLPNYVYRADVSPDGGKVQISVHQKIELGRAGLTTYVIDFKPAGPSTAITTENLKMSPELAAKMQYDINRWKGGQGDCSKAMPAVAALPPAKPATGAVKPKPAAGAVPAKPVAGAIPPKPVAPKPAAAAR
jgi:hypothetical protein